MIRRLLTLCTLAIFVAGTAVAAEPRVKRPQGEDRLNTRNAPGTVSLERPGAFVTVGADDFDGTRTPNAVCPVGVITLFDGTSTQFPAPHGGALFTRSVYLIKATEMTAAGFSLGVDPLGIGWQYSVGSGVAATGTLKVYLQNTADTTYLKGTNFPAAIAAMTLVHDASTTLPATAGTFDINFAGGSPFTYTGGGLYVATDFAWPGPPAASTVACNATGLTGGVARNGSNVAPPDTLAASSFRPITRLKPSVGVSVSDVSVDFVRTLGQLPTPLVGPHAVSAVVRNIGGDPVANLPVSLAITGVQPFADVQMANIAQCGGTATVTFAAFTPTAIGSNTVTVTIPPDDNTANDTNSRPLDETNNFYSYKHPGTIPTGGVGVNAPNTGDFVAKFTTTKAVKISEVNLEFFASSATLYRVIIYSDSAGFPGTQLYVDAADRTVVAAGPVTITLPTPIAVGPGSFYAGIRQNNTTNASYSYDAETPLRPGAMFLAIPAGSGSWADFAPANAFKLNMGVKLIQCAVDIDCDDNNVCTSDACVNELCEYTNVPGPCSDNNACTANDQCAAGVCVPGPNPCEDNNVCTTDICDGQGGCTNPPIICNDGNACTDDDCHPVTGCFATNDDTNTCEDGNDCTSNDTCLNGVCQPGTPFNGAETTFCAPGEVLIPAGGTSGPSGPYPVNVFVTGFNKACRVRVELNGFYHTWPADVDILLSDPGNTRNAIIMSDVGGGGAANAIPAPGVVMTLDDAAANTIPTPLVNGTFKPTNSGAADPVWPAPAPAALGGSALSVFSGVNAAGNWHLWPRDQFAGDAGGLSGGWCIKIVGTPCVSNSDCDDLDACTGTEICNAGTCLPGIPVVCEDGNFCTLDSCNPADGQCSSAPNLCSDGNLCTNDACNETLDACESTPNPNCTQVCNMTGITIPTGGAATPYPSSLTPTGVPYPAVVASVELLGVTHTFPSDVDILIATNVDPSSQNVVLMSDAGADVAVTGVNLLLSDSAADPIPNGAITSGTYQPTDYDGGVDTYPAPAPTPSGTTLSVLNNLNPNVVQYDLYVRDQFTPDEGSIAGWCINFLTTGCVDASECDDSNFCTADTCTNGACSNVFSTAVCDDFNPCTIESCTQDNGCGYAPAVCDDGLSCTTDTCQDFVGCQFTPNGPASALGDSITFSDDSNFEWTPETEAGPFNVYRGSIGTWYSHTCFVTGTGSESASDGSTPAPETGNYYLVSRDNACGESSLGNGTPGPRPNVTPCP